MDITEECRNVIVQAYGDFLNKEYNLGERTAESKIFDNLDFGFNKVTIESPLKDEDGQYCPEEKESPTGCIFARHRRHSVDGRYRSVFRTRNQTIQSGCMD